MSVGSPKISSEWMDKATAGALGAHLHLELAELALVDAQPALALGFACAARRAVSRVSGEGSSGVEFLKRGGRGGGFRLSTFESKTIARIQLRPGVISGVSRGRCWAGPRHTWGPARGAGRSEGARSTWGGAPLCIWRKTENCWRLMENCWKTAQAGRRLKKEAMAPAGAALMRLCSPARTH